MGIQDDIFDVESALEDTTDKESFDRVITYLSDLEETNEKYTKVINDLNRGITALTAIKKGLF